MNNPWLRLRVSRSDQIQLNDKLRRQCDVTHWLEWLNIQTTPVLCLFSLLLFSQICFFPPTYFKFFWHPFTKKQTTGNCSAEVLFAQGEERRSAQVQVSCEELLKIDTLAQQEAFYQQCKMNQSLLSAQNLPGMLTISCMSCSALQSTKH